MKKEGPYCNKNSTLNQRFQDVINFHPSRLSLTALVKCLEQTWKIAF